MVEALIARRRACSREKRARLSHSHPPLRSLAKARALAALLLWLPVTSAQAHRLDEYLQATLVSLEPGEVRLEMNLTPGVAVAGPVLAQIDRDGDGLISEKEAAAYAGTVARDLSVALDGHPLALRVTSSTFPDPAELREGTGIIQLEFTAAVPASFSAGPHRLTFADRHLPAISVYLFNAGRRDFFAVPSQPSPIEITAQQRNRTQSADAIDFIYHAPAKPTPPLPLLPLLAALALAASAVLWLSRATSSSRQVARQTDAGG